MIQMFLMFVMSGEHMMDICLIYLCAVKPPLQTDHDVNAPLVADWRRGFSAACRSQSGDCFPVTSMHG